MLKASELSLDRLIEGSQQSETLLKDYQMTISSMDAWGSLRKDLISALGVERAKRFLLRYGWNSGKYEARMLKDSLPWSDKLEWLIAGTKMHHLTGRALSYPETFHVDMEKGTFNVAGYWIDSYEAEQHLHHFSLHHEPICYYLMGYAGGYTSECMGKIVIFKESQCKGKGDSYCSYKAKTLEAWGDEISDELIYYEDIDMSDELDQMYRHVELQKNKMKIGYTLSHKLTEAMLEGKGLKTFAEILGESIHCPVVIENKQFEILASDGEMPGIDDEITARHAENQMDEMIEGNRRVVTELKDKTFKLITIPIMIRKQIFGFITMAVNNSNHDFNFDLLERVATISALYVQNERITIETEERLKGELVEQLLSNESYDEYEINNRFSKLGYDLTNPYYIFYIEIDNQNNENDIDLMKDKDYLKAHDKLKAFFKRDMETYGTHSLLIAPKLNHMQVIVSQTLIKNKQMTIKKYGEQIQKSLGKPKYPVYIGISEATKKIKHFSKQAEEAKKAVELAKMKTKESTVILSSELGHLTLLLNARDPKELKAFAEGKLDSLLEYDRKKSSALLQTLFSYSQNEFNLHKTARKMHVSISGMRYRIQKIEELLDLELTNSNSRFEIQLSLQILFIFGEIVIS